MFVSQQFAPHRQGLALQGFSLGEFVLVHQRDAKIDEGAGYLCVLVAKKPGLNGQRLPEHFFGLLGLTQSAINLADGVS